MIPRITLKKIRQLEICSGHLEISNNFFKLFQSSVKFFRITRPVKDRNNVYSLRFDRVINAVRKLPGSGFANCWRNSPKSLRRLEYLLKYFVNLILKSFTQPRLTVSIECDGILKFQPGQRRKNHFTLHALRLFNRSWSSAFNCSQGIPRSGWNLNSSARRSNSTACPGDSSSAKYPNSSKNCSVNSRRSCSGNRRICSRISVLLMHPAYHYFERIQAVMGCSAPRAPHSALA